MTIRYYANAPATTLAGSCTDSGTLLTLDSVVGLPIQYPYTLILDRGTSTEEAVSVTSAAGVSLTVTRAYDDTTAFAHAIGATVEHGITAQDIREANAHNNATGAVHGTDSSLMGVNDVQVVTNKDLTSPTNIFPEDLVEVADGLATHAASSVTHGVVGNIVGTNNAQTLTNKTLSQPTLTQPVITDPSTLSFDGLNAVDAWTEDAVIWTSAADPQPSIGNGTLFVRWTRIGKTVHFVIFLQFGSTTSYGTGTWSWSLPVDAQYGTHYPIHINALYYDASLFDHYSRGGILRDTESIQLIASDTNLLGSTTFAYAEADIISIAGTYEMD